MTENIKQDNGSISAYGVWLRNKGWLKKDNDPAKTLVFRNIEMAREVAKDFRGIVRYIDQSLIDIEKEIIEAERKTLWATLTSFFKRNSST